MLLLRNQLQERDSMAAVVKREMAGLAGAMENSVLPLPDVMRVSGLPRVPGRSPAWQVAITWDEEGR